MKESDRTKRFVEGVLGRRWDNFSERVAAVAFLRAPYIGESKNFFRLISKERLDLVVKARNGKT